MSLTEEGGVTQLVTRGTTRSIIKLSNRNTFFTNPAAIGIRHQSPDVHSVRPGVGLLLHWY
jgi:hypothetical protein